MSETSPLHALGAALLDAALVIDGEQKVVEFNGHYRALLPRHLARKLPGSQCCQLLRLSLCGHDRGECLAQRCAREARPLRYDEINAQVDPDGDGHGDTLTVIASAAPLEDGRTMLMLRDVSDTAAMQRKYKEMLDAADRAQEKLQASLNRKTQELMDANTELNRVQQELMHHKKGLFG
ncbi:MAG: hypothetical protein ACE366_26735 [Bradymonadia bacterium]